MGWDLRAHARTWTRPLPPGAGLRGKSNYSALAGYNRTANGTTRALA